MLIKNVFFTKLIYLPSKYLFDISPHFVRIDSGQEFPIVVFQIFHVFVIRIIGISKIEILKNALRVWDDGMKLFGDGSFP